MALLPKHSPVPAPQRRWRLTLRVKALLLLISAVVVLLIGLYIPLRLTLLASFGQLETTTMQTDLARVQNALAQTLLRLDNTTASWSMWDDTYAFVAQPNDAYIATSLDDSIFALYDCDVVLLLDNAGQLVFGKAYDLAAQQARPLPPTLLPYLQARPQLYQYTNPEAHQAGVIVLPSGPLLLASRPIVPSLADAPPRGAMIFGRSLDAAVLQQLGQLTQLSLAGFDLNSTAVPADIQAPQSALFDTTGQVIRPIDDQFIAGYTLLRDMLGAPALILQVKVARTIAAQGQTLLLFFSGAFVVASGLFGLVLDTLFERLVLRRLVRLSTAVARIGVSGDLTARVVASGDDELGQLGQAMNAMLAALAQAQAERRQAEAEHAQLQDERLNSQQERLRMQEELIALHTRLLDEQATPLIPLSERIVVMPLIGTLDARRAHQMMTTLAHGVEARRAHFAIIDLTGVPCIDAAVAEALLTTAHVIRLLGAQLILTGMRPEAAQSLVALGMDLRDLISRATLQDGIKFGLGERR